MQDDQQSISLCLFLDRTPPACLSLLLSRPLRNWCHREGRPQSIVVAVPAGGVAKLKTQVLRTEPLVAPFAKGQAVATLRVTSNDQQLLDLPLLALQSVEQSGVLGRAWDALRLWIR